VSLEADADNYSQISQGRYSYKMSQAGLLVRGSLTSVIYYKALDLDLTAIDDSSTLTLMSVDVERICRMNQGIHQLWANPVELGLAVWLLERQLGVSCIVPVFLALGIFHTRPLFYLYPLIDRQVAH